MLTGHCECGAVRLAADAPIEDFSHCHCGQCRRVHGAAYATFAGVPRAALRFTAGEDRVGRYASSGANVRMFCTVCGSTLGVDPQDGDPLFYLSMSIVEGDPPRPEGYHSYVASKAPWHEITDGLAQYDEDPPGA